MQAGKSSPTDDPGGFGHAREIARPCGDEIRLAALTPPGACLSTTLRTERRASFTGRSRTPTVPLMKSLPISGLMLGRNPRTGPLTYQAPQQRCIPRDFFRSVLLGTDYVAESIVPEIQRTWGAGPNSTTAWRR